jgi:site-specific recombinase XerD
MAARAIAPNEDWSWLQRVTARLKRRSRPARDKRPRLQDTDDLLDLGMELMAGAERTPFITGWRQAVDYRDGLMIALLALRPLRRSNFCSIEVGHHLIQRNTLLLFEKTKTHRPLEQIFPPDLADALDRYLTHYRPWLCWQTGYRDARFPFHPAGDHLWVSRSGSAFGEKGFYEASRKRTLARFGRSLHPHLFRDCAATTIATGDPDHVRITMSVLGHAGMATSERHYNHAQGVEAIRKVQNHILTLRRRAEAERRGKGRHPGAPEH